MVYNTMEATAAATVSSSYSNFYSCTTTDCNTPVTDLCNATPSPKSAALKATALSITTVVVAAVALL